MSQPEPLEHSIEQLPYRRLVITLALFVAVSAIGGAVELLVWQRGNQYLPIALTDHTPFETFLVPGLLLGIVVGGSSLACALLWWRRSGLAIDATILAGGALSVWIAAEIAMMRGVYWLHATFGALGLALLALGLLASWRAKTPRHRWVVSVTLAETVGFLAPACAGILTAKAGLVGVPLASVLVAAGFVEGLVLGGGQAWAFPFRVRRMRYALLTALGAACVWSSVLLMMSTAASGTLPVALLVVAGLIAAPVGLAAIGTLQWLELRHHSERAHHWVAWTALAWAAALPFSFAPGPFVDESTPVASHVVLWGSGGLVMAYVMSLITWQGVRRLSNRHTQAQLRFGPLNATISNAAG